MIAQFKFDLIRENELGEDILVSGVYDLRKLVANVYALSKPVGLGFLQYKEGELSEEEITALIDENDRWSVVNMDYVYGRRCKFHVFKKDGQLYIDPYWYGHTPDQLQELLARSVIK